MNHVRTACITALIAIFLGGSGCAKRPVVYRDASMNSKSVRSARTGFLLPGDIDIREVTQEFAEEFGQHPSDGVSQLRVYLSDFLSGSRKVSTGPPSPVTSTLPFVDLGSIQSPGRLGRLYAVSKDAYGVAHLDVSGAGTLSAILAASGLDYLIVFDIPVLRLNSARAPSFTVPRTYSEINMTAQAFVWSRVSKSTVWQAFVNGYTGKADDRGLSRLANSFAYDLWAALKEEKTDARRWLQ